MSTTALATIVYLLVAGILSENTPLVNTTKVVTTSNGLTPVVNTTNGLLQGIEKIVRNTTLNIYLGVPFAKPPIGDLRYKRPEMMSSWEGVRKATVPQPDCIQWNQTVLAGIGVHNPATWMDEDCLYLNIWSPTEVSGEPKAVLAWIYGGGFAAGSSTVDMFNGGKLAASQNVIVVTLNYRVGALGFLYNGEIEAPGNMGLLDQQMALRWIKDNIAAFGGDPNKVTIYGESAGGSSVNFHLLSEGSRDLFSNGILQSGSCLSYWAYQNPTKAKNISSAFAKMVGCKDANDMTCLRELSAYSISQAPPAITWSATLDGYFFKEEPMAMLQAGNVKNSTIIAGFNKNEGTLLGVVQYLHLLNVSGNELVITKEQFQTMLDNAVFNRLQRKDKILTQAVEFEYETFNWPQSNTYLDMFDRIVGDIEINCDVIDFANYYSDLGGKVYMYYLQHRPINMPEPKWLGVLHGVDIDYVFGNAALYGWTYNFTREEEQLSNKMMTHWANIAKSGNPNDPSLPDWPLYTPARGSYIPFDIRKEATPGMRLRARECAFWRSYVPKLVKEIPNKEKCVTGSSSKTEYGGSLFFTLTFLSFMIF